MAQKEIWEIVLTKPAEKVYDKSSKDITRRFDSCFEDLEKDPLYGNNIKHLTGQLRGFFRYRVGDWQVIFRLFKEWMSGKKVVEIVAILPIGDAYK